MSPTRVGIIGVPCRERGRWASFGDCLDALERPAGVEVLRARNNSVAWARNMLAQEVLDSGAEWVFFLDDDQMFRPDVLKRMLKHPEDIVIGNTLQRYRAYGNTSFRPIWSVKETPPTTYPERPVWEPVEEIVLESNGMMKLLSGTGGGVLVRRKVFETIPPLWWTIGQVFPDMFWEDIWFCQLVRQHGFTVWGDPRIIFGHTMPVTLWPHEDEQGNWSTVLAHEFEPFLMQHWPAPEKV